MCRCMIEAGHDPSTRLEVYRGAILALTVRSIGEGSQLTVKSASNGTPVFVKKAERNSAAAPPMRQTGRPAAHPSAPPKQAYQRGRMKPKPSWPGWSSARN